MFSSDPRSVLPLRTIARLLDLPQAFAWFGFEGALDVLQVKRMQKTVHDIANLRDEPNR